MKKNKNMFHRSWRTMSFSLLFMICLFAAASVSAQTLIYNNGNIATGIVANRGTVAPSGTQWAEAQNEFGNTTESNTNSGYSCYLGTGTTQFRLADDFTIPAGENWTINEVIAYAYQTGAIGTTSPITGGVLQIWNGRPGDGGSTVIFGDLTANRLSSSENTDIFRIFNSAVPAPGSTPGTTRRVFENHLTVSPPLTLTTGTYWVDFRFERAANGTLFCPSVTEEGVRGITGDNGRQFSGTTNAWVDTVDTGTPATAPDFIQDLPFKLAGTMMAGGNPIFPKAREFDFDNDGRSDPAVVRSAGATGESTWYILSNGTLKAVPFGLGVGVGGDVAVPSDYDGDGLTDVAVWRPGAAGFYYIIYSNTNTFGSLQFGKTGDDPRLVGDYDGDGKDDPAVYRDGSLMSGQSFFFYFPSSVGGNPSTDFVSVPWGATGDIPVPGDFDGDRKFDFHVARASGGNYTHYQKLSNGGTAAFNYGLSSDKLVPGLFDNDRKTDLAAVRNTGGSQTWYILRSETDLVKAVTWGATSDTLVPGDYDGDLETDIAIRTGGDYLILNSNRGPFNYVWGFATDYPIANFDVF